MIVPFLLGSKVDMEHAAKIQEVLDDFGIKHKTYIASAHKVPAKTLEIINKYNEKKESVVFVTIAGRSNALSGLTAGSTHWPVVASPPFKDKSDYLVNIHSTLQMPSEIPVVTIIDPGNAGQAVVRILALSNKDLVKKIKNHIKVVKKSFN